MVVIQHLAQDRDPSSSIKSNAKIDKCGKDMEESIYIQLQHDLDQ